MAPVPNATGAIPRYDSGIFNPLLFYHSHKYPACSLSSRAGKVDASSRVIIGWNTIAVLGKCVGQLPRIQIWSKVATSEFDWIECSLPTMNRESIRYSTVDKSWRLVDAFGLFFQEGQWEYRSRLSRVCPTVRSNFYKFS
jgi:hypothetical protein